MFSCGELTSRCEVANRLRWCWCLSARRRFTPGSSRRARRARGARLPSRRHARRAVEVADDVGRAVGAGRVVDEVGAVGAKHGDDARPVAAQRGREAERARELVPGHVENSAEEQRREAETDRVDDHVREPVGEAERLVSRMRMGNRSHEAPFPHLHLAGVPVCLFL